MGELVDMRTRKAGVYEQRMAFSRVFLVNTIPDEEGVSESDDFQYMLELGATEKEFLESFPLDPREVLILNDPLEPEA